MSKNTRLVSHTKDSSLEKIKGNPRNQFLHWHSSDITLAITTRVNNERHWKAQWEAKKAEHLERDQQKERPKNRRKTTTQKRGKGKSKTPEEEEEGEGVSQPEVK